MSKFLKKENIKSLKGLVKPVVIRNEYNRVLSVGMKEGDTYYMVDTIKKQVEYKAVYSHKKQEAWKRGRYYLSDIAAMIDKGNIMIDDIEPEQKNIEVKNQLAMF